MAIREYKTKDFPEFITKEVNYDVPETDTKEEKPETSDEQEGAEEVTPKRRVGKRKNSKTEVQ